MNIRQDTVIKFNICNLSKPNKLYDKGMKPFVYSMNKFKQKGVGWHRAGENCEYYNNGQVARFAKKTLDAHWLQDGSNPVGKDSLKQLHSLSFEYKFEYDYDIVYFAHFVPYTYTDLVNYLCTLRANDALKDRMRVDHICNALGGAPLYGLTITNDIQKGYVVEGKEIFKYQRYEYKKVQVKPKKIKYIEPEKKTRTKKQGQEDGSDSDSVSDSVKSSKDGDEPPKTEDQEASGQKTKRPTINVEPLHEDGKAGES